MEISRHQFLQKLPEVEKAIKECDFMAIDTELSGIDLTMTLSLQGLHRPPTPVRLYNMADRYQEYKEATERFLIIQFGLCTFTWDEPSGRYIAKPFNFYIFPTSTTGQIQANRVFMTQAQAFDFLTKQSFDFNKWVYQGIPYLTVAEEEAFVAAASKKMSDNMPDIPIDDKERDFVNEAKQKIKDWIQADKTAEDEGVNITAKNAYQRRLIYQEARKFEGLTAIGMQGFIRVVRLSEKQAKDRQKEKQDRFEKDRASAIGFRKVIDLISQSGKTMVGHNMLLDVCHIVGQFVEPLPETLPEFKALAHRLFPRMADTKYMCTAEPELNAIFGSGTALESLRFETKKEQFKNPHIDMHPGFPRYLTEMAHEAGYDAFMTGFVFLKLVAYLDKTRNPEKYAAIEEERLAEAEAKEEERQRETQPKVDADGWEISEDEDQDNDGGNWDLQEEEEVYNYGSVRVDLTNKDGKMDNVLSAFNNKTALVRTAYDCFDFQEPEIISNQSNTILVKYSPGTAFDMATAESVFSEYGKFIIEPNDASSSFVIFEKYREDPATIRVDDDAFTIAPVAEYLENRHIGPSP
ncbi:hypothetical protein MUCCIDRAFT_162862 [Mucor lusitanicus CBS 277.49]|uniref:Uncharacterized protein n=1 Tax=Mucor lusitanicus CBS 277.49 TaxID=747725 RepID=A0A168LA61_MUCCL|nr:hypothetical protein MUCCIDRAFT_162862 [Mucor lusitanicus CBS 277.49]